MGVVIVEGEGAVLWTGEFGASYCNQWDLCDALFSNYFEDLFRIAWYCSVYNRHISLKHRSGLASFSVEIDNEATKLHQLIADDLIAFTHLFQRLRFKHTRTLDENM